MSESNRVLRLEKIVVEVPLAGETYFIRKQRRAVLEKVLLAMHPEGAQRELPPDPTMRQLIEFSSLTLQEAFPIVALMLGVEETDPNYAKTLEHLEEHLAFDDAQQIYEEWRKLNRVEHFFYFGGNPLIPQERFQEFLKSRNGQNGDADAASEPSAPEENSSETPTSLSIS